MQCPLALAALLLYLVASSECYFIVSEQKQMLCGPKFSLHTSKGTQFISIDDRSFSIKEKEAMTFRYRGKNNMHVLLQNRKDDFDKDVVDIAVGENSITFSSIWRPKYWLGGAIDKLVPDLQIADPNQFRSFWISWKNGIIRCGLGHEIGKDEFMSYSNTAFKGANYFSVSSGPDSDGDWEFGGTDCAQKCKSVECPGWFILPALLFNQQECKVTDASEIISISVEKQYLLSNCIKDKNYGLRGESIWVNRECSAQFKVCYQTGDGTKERQCGIYTNGCHELASCQRKGDTEYCACKAGYYGNGVDSCGGACTCTGSGDPHYKTFDGSMIHFQGICKYVLSELRIGSPCDYRVLVQNEHRHGNTRVSFTKRVDVEIRNTTISLRKDRMLFVNRERKYTPFEADDLTYSIFMRGSGEIVVQTSCKVIVIYDGYERVSVTVPVVYGRNITGLCGNCNGEKSDDFLTKERLDVSKEQDRYARIGNSFAVPDPETPPEICAMEDVKITCSPEFKGLAASNDYCGLLRNITGPFADFIKKEPAISEKIWEACLYDVCSFEDNLAEATKTACKALENFAKTIQENGQGKITWRTAARCPMTCGENMEYSLNVGVLPTCTSGVQSEQYDVTAVDGCTCKPGFVQSGDKCVRKEECGCKTKVGNQYLPVGETFVTEDCRFMNQCQYRNGKSEIVTLETRPACHLLAQCKPDETTGQYKCQCQKGTVGDGITSCIAACGNAKKPCHPNAICTKGMEKQVNQCRCKDGYFGDGFEKCTKSCECVASGDPHYTTFDGQKIHFQGLCKYTLASIPYCSINVEVKNQPVPGNKVSTTKLVEVKLPSTKIRIGQKKNLLINGEIAYAPIEGIGYRIYEKGSMVVETDCGVVVMFDGANTARVLVPSQYGNNVTGICGNCDGIQNDFRTKTGQFVSGEAKKYSLIGDSYVVPDETEQGSESCQTESVDPTCPQEWDIKKKSNEYCGLILDPKGPFGQCLAKYPEIAKSDGIISDCTYDVCANSADPKNAQESACTALAMLAYWCQQKSDIDIIAWRKADFCPLKECGENMDYNPAIMQCPTTCQDPMRRTPCHAGLSEGCECKPGFFRSGAACVPREQCGCAVQNKYYPLNTTVTSSDCRKRYICVHKDGSSYMEKLEDSPPCGAKASCRLNNGGNYQCQCDKNYKGDGFTCENVCGIQSKVCHKYASCLSKGNIQYCSCKAGYYGNGVDSCGGACTCTGSGDPHYKTFDGSMIHFQGICKYLLSELSVGSECDYRVLVQNENRQGNTRVSFTKRVDIEIGNTIISLRKDRLLFVNGERKYPPLEANDLSFSIFMRGSGEIVVQTSCKVIVIFDGNQRVSVTVPDFYGRNLTGLCGNCNGDTGDDFLTMDKLDVSKEQDRYARIGNSFAVPDKETPPEICPTENVKIKCSPEFLAVANSAYYCGLLSGTTGPFADFIKKEPETAAKYFEACLFDVCAYEGNLTEAKRTACDTLDSYAKALQEKGLGRVIWRSSERCPLTCGENMEYSTNVGAVPTCSDINGVPAQQFDVPTVDGCVCKQGFLLSGDRCVRKEECGCKVDNQYLPVGEKFATEDCRLLKQCQYKNGKSEIVTLETRPACHLLAQCKPDETTGQYKCQCQKGTVGDGITSCIAACGYANKPCHFNAICSKGTGKQLDQCRCKEGYYGDGIEKCTKSCECVASGDPHYTTFDGQKIHFQGLCKYTLASIPYCSINVEVKNQPVPGNKVSTTKLVEVKLPSTKIRIGQKKNLLINGEIAYAPIEGIGYRIYEKGSMVVETDCGVVVMFDGANTARVLVPSQYGNNVTGICGNCDGIQNDFRTKTGQFVSGEAKKYSLIGDSYVVPDETEQGSESCQTENVDPTCPQEWDSKKMSNEYCGLILDPKGPFGQCLAKYPEIAKSDGIISDCTYDVCANSADPKNAQESACTALAMLAYWCQQKSDIDIIAWRKADFCPLKECGENMDYNPAIMQCPTTCQDPMRRTLCHAGLSEGCECKPGFFRSGAACVPREQCGCTVQSKYYPLNTTVTSSDCRKRYICVHKDGSSYMERLEDSPPCGAKASCRLNNEGNYQCQCDKNYKGDGFTCENVCGIQSKVCHKYASCLSKGNIQYCSCKAGYYGNGVDSCGGACTCTGSGDPHYKTFDGSMIHFQGICKYLLSELSVGSECDYRVLVQNENRQGNTRVSFTKRVDIEIGNTIISLRKDRLLFVNGERKYPPLEANDLSFSIFMRGSGEIVVQTSCKVIVIFDGNQRVSVTVPDFYGRNLTGLCGNCNGDTGDDFLTMDKLDVSKEQDRYARIGNSFAVPDKETPPEICPTENVKIKCSPEFLAVANSAYYCGLLSGTTGPFADFIKKEPETAAKYFEACLFDVCAYEGNLTEAKRTACDTLDSYAKALQEKGLGRVIWRSSERCPLTCGENMEYSTNVGAVPTCSDINGVPAQQFDVPTVDGCVCKQGFLLSGDRCVRKEECGCKVDNQYLPVGEKFATEDCRLLKQCQYKNGKSEIVTLETRPACHLLAQCKPDETTGQYKCQCQKGTVGDGITSCIAACGYANKPCHFNAICSKGTGKQLDQCRCKEGYYGDGIEKCTKSCECVASGDPHYTTFDGQKIHFQGLCKYTLASIPYCSINVEVKNQPVPGNKVSTTKLVEVKLPSTKIRIGQKKNLLINGEIAYAPIEGIGYRIYVKGSMVVETDCGVVVMFDGANTARVLVPSQYGNNVTGICGNCDGIQNDFRTKTGQFVSGEAKKYSLIGDSYVVPDETEQGSESCQTENVDPTCPQEWDSKKMSNEYCGLILDPKGPFGQCLAKYPEIAKSDGIISDCTYDVCANSADPKNAQESACTALAMLAYWCQQKSDIDIIAWRKADFCPLKECGENMDYNPAIMQCPTTCQDPMRRTLCHAGLSEGCECKPGFFRSGAACVPREQCGCTVQSKYYPLNTTVTSSDCRKRYICVHKDGSSYMERLEDSPPCGAKASCRLNNGGNYQCQCDKNYKGDGFTCENVCGIQSKVCHKYASCLSKGNIQYCSCKAGYYGNGVDSCGGACTCTGSGDPHYKTFDGSMIHFQGICKYLLSELSVGSECDYRVLVQNENRQGNTRVSFTKRVDIEIGNTIISLRKDRLLFVNGERKYPPLEANDLTFSIFMRGSGEIVVQTSCKVIVIFDGNQRVSVTVPDFYGRNLTGLCGNCNGDTGDDFLTMDKLDVSKEQDRYARIGNSFAVPDKETPPEICPTENVKIKCSPEFLAVANSAYYCGLLSGTTGPFADFIKKEPETAAKYFEACLFDVCAYEGNLTEAKRTACDTLDSYAKALQEKGLGRVIWRSSERCPLTCGENMEYSTNVGAVPTCSDINGVPAQQFDVPTVDGCVCKQGFLLSGDRCVRKEECGCKVDNQYLPVGEKFATEDCRLLKQCQYKNGKSEIVTLETRPACHLLAQCKPDETTGQYKCQCQKGTVGDGITSCIAACGYANKPCHFNAICSKGTGKQLDQCRCKEGYYGDGIEKCTKSCECVASGDPHYTTFDGQKIHFQGLCKYTLASIPYCSINVEVKNQPVPGNKVSTTKLVEVKLPSTKIRIGQKKNLLINGEIAYAPIEGIGYRIYEKGSMVVETDCGVVVMFDGANTARVLVPSQYGNNVTGICGNCDGIQNDFRTKTGQFVSGEANKYSLIGDSYVVPDETEQGFESCQTESVDPTCPQEWDIKKKSNEYCGLILDPKGPFGQCLAKYPEIAKSDGIISDCTYDVCANSADPKNAQESACTALAMLAYWCQQKTDIDIIAWRKADFCPLKECGENMDYNPAIMQCPTTCQDPMRRTLCHAGLSEGCECKPGFFRSGAACVPREQCGCTVQSKYYPLNTTVTSSDCRKRYICVHKDGSSYMERLEDSPPCGAKASCRLNNEGNYQCQCDKYYKGDGFTCENLPPSNENGTCSVTETTTGCNTVKIIKGNCYYTSNFKGQCRYVVNMIHANAAIVYIGDSKAIRLDSYNTKEYVDCAAFKMEFRQVTVKEPTCGCE